MALALVLLIGASGGSVYAWSISVNPRSQNITSSAELAGMPFPGPSNVYANLGAIRGSSFDFSLTLWPSSITVKQGDMADYEITTSYSDPSYSGTPIALGGVTDEDVIDCTPALGPGMSYQLILTPPTLRVFTSQSTPPGVYTMTLVGSAMGIKHQTGAVLVVEPAEQPTQALSEEVTGTLQQNNLLIVAALIIFVTVLTTISSRGRPLAHFLRKV
jgi:hypothetical protein